MRLSTKLGIATIGLVIGAGLCFQFNIRIIGGTMIVATCLTAIWGFISYLDGD